MIAVGGIRAPAEVGTDEIVRVLDNHRPFEADSHGSIPLVDQSTVERLATALPGVKKEEHRFAFYVDRGRRRPVAWEWLAADYPGGPRLPRPGALAIRTATLKDRDRLIESAPGVFFVDLHYAGYPCVVARLDQISEAGLGRVLTAAWRTQALLRSPGPRVHHRGPSGQLPLAV